MKRILSLITALLIILTVFAAHAENTTIGSGLTTPSQGTPSTVTSGIGGSLTPPGGSLAPVQPSANNGKNNRPSPEWLSALDAPLINDLMAMSTDPYTTELWGIPEMAYATLNPAAEYEPLPSVIMYGPDRVPLIIAAAVGSDISDIYSGLLEGFIYSAMSSEELAMSTAVKLIDYQPTDTEYVYTVAIYTSASEPDSNPILAIHTWKDGISTITAQFITADTLNLITEDDNEIAMEFDLFGLEVFRADSVFPEFNASIEPPAGAEMAVADDEWLSGTAFVLAEQIIEMASDSEFVSLYTISPDIIDTCSEFAEFDIANAEVVSIQPYEIDDLFTFIAGSNDSECPELLAKHFGPKVGSAFSINKISSSSSTVVAATTICNATASYFADSDFNSCNVTLSCGGKYDIVVSFGNYGDGIITAEAKFVPAE